MDEKLLQNNLVKGQEDERGFDLLNEETFGNLGSYDDDWENEHELFAEADTRCKVGDQSPDLIDEDGFYEGTFQSDMENQLTRLVLEEDDVVASNYARPYDMWADSLNLDFTKCTRMSNGFKEPDRTTCIKDNPALFLSSKDGYTKNGHILSSQGAMTVEDLEKMLLTDGTSPINQGPPKAQVPFFGSPKPQMLPLLPFDIRAAGCQPYQPGLNAMIHSQDGHINSRMTPMVPPSQPTLLMPQHQFHLQHLQGFGQNHLTQQGVISRTPFLPNTHFRHPHQNQPSQQFNSQQMAFPQHSVMSQQHQMLMRHQHILRQQQLLTNHRHLPQDHHQSRVLQDPSRCGFPRHQGHTDSQQFPLCHQQQFQQHQMMMMMSRLPHPFGPCPPRPYWEHPAARSNWQAGQMLLSKEDAEKHEMKEYDGLMEQREKDWIIKIQLMQLQTDNPYIDDYYFTCWSMKKLIKDNLKKKRQARRIQQLGGETMSNDVCTVNNDDDEDYEDDEAPALLVPQLSKSDNKPYAPVQYEGSLGKLTASSIHNPRQIIDIHLSSNSEDAKKQDSKKLKELYGKIEKSFDVLLEADDLEKNALAQPTENRLRYYEDRNELVSGLCKNLLADEASFLQQALSIRKGVVLVIRLLLLALEIELASEIVCKILERLIGVLKREWSDEISSNLFKCVSKIILNHSSLAPFFNAICQNFKVESSHMYLVIHSQLGLSLVLLLMDRLAGNELSSRVDTNEWQHFIQSVLQCLASTNSNALPSPFKIQCKKGDNVQLGQHFDLTLNRLVQLLPIVRGEHLLKASKVMRGLFE